MTKLPNAPLVEVIFELRWKISSKEDLSAYQYLIGDLYAEVKNKYPFRESLVSPTVPSEIVINNPVHRYRIGKNEYPLVQLGPGVMTLNTIHDEYDWEKFYSHAEFLLEAFFNVFSRESHTFTPKLSYIDFFDFDFENDNVLSFLNDKFGITIGQNFTQTKSNPTAIELGFHYPVEEGRLNLSLKRGQNPKNQSGVMMETAMHSTNSLQELKDVLNWLDRAHKKNRSTFREITKGKLYESFN